MKILHGHESPATAHLTCAYPFGQTRCVRREWIETAVKGPSKHLMRFVTQTTIKSFNLRYTAKIKAEGQEAADAWARETVASSGPGLWNAIKPSTYASLAIMVERPLADESGRLGVAAITYNPYSSPDAFAASRDVQAQLSDREAHLLARLEAMSRRLSPQSWAFHDAKVSQTLEAASNPNVPAEVA